MGLNFSPTASSWFIGTFAVLHFILVSIAGLAPLTIFLMEGYAIKKDKPYLRRTGKQLLTIVLELAAAGGIVYLLILTIQYRSLLDDLLTVVDSFSAPLARRLKQLITFS